MNAGKPETQAQRAVRKALEAERLAKYLAEKARKPRTNKALLGLDNKAAS